MVGLAARGRVRVATRGLRGVAGAERGRPAGPELWRGGRWTGVCGCEVGNVESTSEGRGDGEA